MKKPLITTVLLATATFSHAAELDFSQHKGIYQQTDLNGTTVKYRAYEGIIYVKNPVDAQHQTMNIYIPEAYFNGDSIDGFTADNAPIFFPNQIGGYMPAEPATPTNHKGNKKQNTILMALSKGYVVASAGARGRTASNGKAPADIVDLKAAIRYLHVNDKVMAGDANKIISNGTSAGGAMSVLLGATGNSKDYLPYLEALGAANASDAIFAVSAYCPITNLENADTAYEWQFNGVDTAQIMNISMLDYKVKRELKTVKLTAEQTQTSNTLKALFPDYLNSLKLKDQNGNLLTLDKEGNGSFKTYLENQLLKSANVALAADEDLNQFPFLTLTDGKATAIDFAAYNQFNQRSKIPPAFDAFDLSTGENQLFGTENNDKQHFTDYGMKHSTVKSATRAEKNIVSLMNPMNYLDTGKEAVQAPYWRIRVGTNDRDTSLAISAIIATRLNNMGKNVDYFLPWNVPHSGDYDLDELFAWIKNITTQ